MHLQVSRQSEHLVALRARVRNMLRLIMIFKFVSGLENTLAQLAFDLIVVSFHVRLQMILRRDLLVAHLASINGNLNPVESAVAR